VLENAKCAESTIVQLLSSWKAHVRSKQWCHSRYQTICIRHYFTICRPVWKAWARSLLFAGREVRSQFARTLEEANAEDVKLHSEICAVKPGQHESDLAHLMLIDELQDVVAEIAEFTVDVRDAEDTQESLEHVLKVECEDCCDERAGVAALEVEFTQMGEQESQQRALLEQSLEDALEAPLFLRAELRHCGTHESREALAEREAEETATALYEGHAEWHKRSEGRFRQHEDDVMRWQQRVRRAQQSVCALEEELAQQQHILWTRELQIKQYHRADTLNERNMFPIGSAWDKIQANSIRDGWGPSSEDLQQRKLDL